MHVVCRISEKKEKLLGIKVAQIIKFGLLHLQIIAHGIAFPFTRVCECAPLTSFNVFCWFSILHRALNVTVTMACWLNKPCLWKLFGRTCFDIGVCAAFVLWYTPDCYKASLSRQRKWTACSNDGNLSREEERKRMDGLQCRHCWKLVPRGAKEKKWFLYCWRNNYLYTLAFLYFVLQVLTLGDWLMRSVFIFCPFSVSLHEFSALLFFPVTPFCAILLLF